MSKYKNQVFISTVAEFLEDIATSWEIQKPLTNAGYSPGLMVVIRGADEQPRVTDAENRDRQYSNLEKYSSQYGDAPIVTMLSNMPIEQIDFLHNTSDATKHVLAGIDFARGLPIGGRKILTHHLNSLVSEQEFQAKSRDQWYELFDRKLKPKLREISNYTQHKEVDILIETVPTPEFGDIGEDDDRTYREVKLRDLRNPFYHFSGNPIWKALTKSGLGVCLDLCHTFQIYRQALGNRQGLFEQDVTAIRENPDLSLQEDLKTLSPQRDIVHLNDGAGRYTRQGGTFQEGVILGQGEIANMRGLINYINTTQIPFVLEINETDFKKRPNTKVSINYLLKQD